MLNLDSPNKRQRAVAVVLCYALLVLLMTMPALLHLSQRLVGEDIDIWIFYWNNWWIDKAISEGRDWFFTPYLFYPQGTSLATHSNSLLNSLLAFALKPLTGPVAAYNLVFLFGLWSGALGMFWLVDDLTQQTGAAFIAGFIFAFAPYHLTQAMAHAHLGSIHWFPWYALFLHRLLDKHRLRDLVLAALFASFSLWSGLQLSVLLALWTLAYLLWRFLQPPYVRQQAGKPVLQGPVGKPALRVAWRAVLVDAGWLALVGVIAALMCAPVLIPTLTAEGSLDSAAAAFDESHTQQTDLMAYLLPSKYNALFGKYTQAAYENFEINRLYTPYIGYSVLVLLGIAALLNWRQTKFWLISSALWALLAAGPALRFNEQYYPQVRLPYALVGGLFPISTLRSPDRFNLLLVFSFSVAAGLGIAALRKHQKTWLLLPLGLLLLAEYASLPLPTTTLLPKSPYLERIAQDEIEYAIVDCPMGYHPSKRWLYYQTVHHKPTVEGHISRYTFDTYAFIANQPLLSDLYRLGGLIPWQLDVTQFETTELPPAVIGPAVRSLHEQNIRYILLHKSFIPPEQQATYADRLGGMPIYEDEILATYDTACPNPYHYDAFPLQIAPGLVLDRLEISRGRLEVEADTLAWTFKIVAHPGTQTAAPVTCQMALISAEAAQTDSESAPLSSSAPITLFDILPPLWQWGAEDIGVYTASDELPPDLALGSYVWQLRCAGGTYTVPDVLEKHPDSEITYLRRQTDLRFGEDIRLTGYRWHMEGTNLKLELLWEALQKPPADYKVFVHLLDEGGELASQYDAMPCNWACPTGGWQAGDVILDSATMPLSGVGAGTYTLHVGFYNPETLKRLSVTNADGKSSPDAAAHLPDIVTISEPCSGDPKK